MLQRHKYNFLNSTASRNISANGKWLTNYLRSFPLIRELGQKKTDVFPLVIDTQETDVHKKQHGHHFDVPLLALLKSTISLSPLSKDCF